MRGARIFRNNENLKPMLQPLFPLSIPSLSHAVLRIRRGPGRPLDDCVQMIRCNSAKGLEFRVFLAGMEDGCFRINARLRPGRIGMRSVAYANVARLCDASIC